MSEQDTTHFWPTVQGAVRGGKNWGLALQNLTRFGGYNPSYPSIRPFKGVFHRHVYRTAIYNRHLELVGPGRGQRVYNLAAIYKWYRVSPEKSMSFFEKKMQRRKNRPHHRASNPSPCLLAYKAKNSPDLGEQQADPSLEIVVGTWGGFQNPYKVGPYELFSWICGAPHK